jgi:hypothetical protein
MTALVIWLTTWASDANAADIHLRLTGGDGVMSIEESWPSMESFTKRYGPFTFKKVPTMWTLTVQPSVHDVLTGTYLTALTACVKWSHKGDNEEHCEKYDLAAGQTETVVASQAVKGKGVKLDWTLSTWYTGEAPPSGLPTPEPRPSPGYN